MKQLINIARGQHSSISISG